MLIEFIIPTFQRYKPLRSLLASLEAQTDNDWKATVIIDDVSPRADILDILRDFDKSQITWTFSGKRYNDFGHTPRQLVKQISTADYIIMTGDDNYYIPTLVAEIKSAINNRISTNPPGFIYWDMIHSHYNYQYFKCTPGYNQIDMGAFATRTDLAKQIKLGTGFAADGEFVENLKKAFPNESYFKINKVLFVHN